MRNFKSIYSHPIRSLVIIILLIVICVVLGFLIVNKLIDIWIGIILFIFSYFIMRLTIDAFLDYRYKRKYKLRLKLFEIDKNHPLHKAWYIYYILVRKGKIKSKYVRPALGLFLASTFVGIWTFLFRSEIYLGHSPSELIPAIFFTLFGLIGLIRLATAKRIK